MGQNCTHPNSSLKNFREPTVGDANNLNGNVSLEADCVQCDGLVLVDARITETMELE